MGAFRLFLALSVLNNHFQFAQHGPWIFGPTAVAAFFIISGFYISMVLDQTYRGYDAVWRFFTNRFLRLMPVYWVTLALTVIATLSASLSSSAAFDPTSSLITSGSALNWHGRIAGMVSNVLLFPASIYTMVSGFHTKSAWNALVSGQMYTVGLEIMFYVLAPLLVLLSSRWFIAALIIAAAAHFAPFWLNLSWRPWQYEFFPCVLVFFLMGNASYKLSKIDFSERVPARLTSTWLGWLAFIILICMCTFLELEKYTNTWQTCFFYISLVILIPWLFRASANAKWDRFIGDLSYPVYVCHFLVMSYLTKLGWTNPWIGLSAVVLASVMLRLCIDLPIERWRTRIRATPRSTLRLRPAL